MRRVLVPIDGTALSSFILPDARRLAGPDGTIILVRDAGGTLYGSGMLVGIAETQEAEEALEDLAEQLRSEGVDTEAHTLALVNPADAIDAAAGAYRADMIACASHGRSAIGRLLRGGVAWKALSHSPVPVLLRHMNSSEPIPFESVQRHIMVPLDGSNYSERALPLAYELAAEWDANILLIQVVAPPPTPAVPYSALPIEWEGLEDEREMASRYLSRIANGAPNVRTQIRVGAVTSQLLKAVNDQDITDVVMASHGRTGLARMIVGSVADELIHQLRCPVIVIPSMEGADHHTEEQTEKEPALV